MIARLTPPGARTCVFPSYILSVVRGVALCGVQREPSLGRVGGELRIRDALLTFVSVGEWRNSNRSTVYRVVLG